MRNTDLYKKMTPYQACSYAEGWNEATEGEQLTAWQYIKDTGLWKYLQGFYGRTVRDLTDAGVIE